MPYDHSYQLLAAKFCHDLASPINAMGLILEMIEEDNYDYSHIKLAQQNQTTLVNILNLYRIFFAYRSQQDLFAKSISTIKALCLEKEVSFTLSLLDSTVSDKIGKISACLFYIFYGLLQKNDSISLIESKYQNYTFNFLTKKNLPYQNLLEILNSPSPTTTYPSPTSLHFFLKYILDIHHQKLNILPSGSSLTFSLFSQK